MDMDESNNVEQQSNSLKNITVGFHFCKEPIKLNNMYLRVQK